jgi:DNA-binding NtrC family response regulator
MGTAARPPADQVALVVEDQAEVRHMVARILADAGFSVTEAESGDDAVAQISLLRGRVQLLVSDVAMPGISGDALAATVCERWPGMPVLLISGAPGRGGKYNYPFLQKPFTPDALLDAVSRLVPPSNG